jgi:hypothetical protein
MVLPRLIAVMLTLGLLAVGCGWSPPSTPPTNSVACSPADGPSAEAVQQAIATLPAPAPGSTWREIARGHTANCRLHWVQVRTGDASNSPQQVLFFDRHTFLGTATPDPRSYITVVPLGDDTVVVQYQWQQGSDPACCPTGIGTVRFRIGEDGKLKALDPIPNP